MLKIKDMNLNNVIRQGDSQPREYQLDTGSLNLNLINKSAAIRLMTADFQGIGYETTATVSGDNKISFSIDDVIPAREYRLEVTVDDYVFPSRATDGQFNIDPSSHGQEASIIQIIGKDEIVREVKEQIEPFLGEIEQAEREREETYEKVKDLPEAFQNVIDETTGKDVISAPEIIDARKGKASLGAKIDEIDSQKIGGGKKAELEDLSPTVLSAIEGGEGTTFNLLSIPQDGSVTPEKTSFFEPSDNLFKGNYLKGVLNYTNNVLSYSFIDTLTQSIAVIPIEPNETYTVSVIDTTESDKFHIGILNDMPEMNKSSQPVDSYVFHSFSYKTHTFENTSTGKYALIGVSSDGKEPRMKFEKGPNRTEYEEFPKISDKYINFKDDVTFRDYDAEKESLGVQTEQLEKAKVIDLITGDNTDLSVTYGVLSYDSNYKKRETPSLKLVPEADKTAYVQRHLTNEELINLQSLAAWVYFEDVESIDNLYLHVLDNNGVGFIYNLSFLTDDGISLKNGWNLLRWRTDVTSYPSNFGKLTRVRIMFLSKEPKPIYISAFWAEKFEKGKLIFIHDGGYREFFQKDGRGYQDLKARGLPCTIASIPKKIGDPLNDRFISKADLYELSMENENEISIHSFDGQDEIATMTAEELREESFNAIDMLRSWGHNPLWRAAWFRNNAPNAYGSEGLFHAFAYTSRHSMVERIESFPFQAPYNVRRIQIHWRNREDLDKHFAALKSNRGVMVAYTHNVADDSSGDISVSDWDYFLSKVDQGVSEGWLEGATFKQLLEPYI